MEVPSGNLRTEFESVTELNSFSYPTITSDSKVVPVIDINPKHARVSNKIASFVQATSSAGSALLATVAGRDYYVNGLVLSVIKDATCDAADGVINIAVKPFGEATAVICLAIPTLTLTAQQTSIAINFSTPIRLLRNNTTALYVNAQTFTAGKLRVYAQAVYTEENSH